MERQNEKKPKILWLMCVVYGVFVVFGYVLFGESQWLRTFKGGEFWGQNFATFESWIKGHGALLSHKDEALVLVEEVRGRDALMVRDFSSLVFRSVYEKEFLRGRNVLMTKAGVSARLWLTDYNAWLDMKPNTLIILNTVDQGDGQGVILSLDVLAGSWGLQESRNVASQGRDPSSTSAPKIIVKDYVTMKEYDSQGPAFLNEVSVLDGENLLHGGSFLGSALSIEGGGAGFGQEIGALAQAMEAEIEPEYLFEELDIPQRDPASQTAKSYRGSLTGVDPRFEKETHYISSRMKEQGEQSRRSLRGSLYGMGSVLEAETYYISSQLKARASRRSPAAAAVGLSVALESASVAPGIFNGAVAQALEGYTDFYLHHGECEMLKNLHENVKTSYSKSSQRESWERIWRSKVEASACRQIL